MTVSNTMSRSIGRSPLIAIVLYMLLVGACVTITVISLSAIIDRQRTLAQTSELLDQLQGRRTQRSSVASSLEAEHPGSPFLEGPTVTVAGASLLQRVAGAVTSVGGTIQSSQVDLLGVQAKDGFVGLLVSCEMEQSSLQKLLYDLEVGMPYLFVDQLDVQVPQTTAANETGDGRVRVVLGVSGQWQGSK